MRVLTVITIITVLVLVAAIPAVALEIKGEHRIMVTRTNDLELRAAEALVVRHEQHWLELVVTQRWSQRWPAKLEGEVSLWRSAGDVDIGIGYVWRIAEGKGEPWVMVAMPW